MLNRGYRTSVYGIVSLVLCFAIILAFSACSGTSADTTELTINLGDAGAKAFTWPPDDIVYYTLTVSGDDMATEEVVFPGGVDALVMLIPRGNDRLIEVEAFKNPLSESAVISWRGSTTMDLKEPLASASIPMGLGETKLVIPDAGGAYATPKIIQMNDMNAFGWTTLFGSEIPGLGWLDEDLQPYDIDFDKYGRIYIANYNGSTDFGRVLRIDAINGANYFLYTDQASNIRTIAVDRENEYLYYASSSNLWKENLDGTGNVSLTITDGVEGINTILGMDIDIDGILYIVGREDISFNERIFKYNPYTQLVEDTFSDSNLITPRDIVVKSHYIYITNTSGADNWRIMRINKDFTSPVGYGYNSSGTISFENGAFYGARIFISKTKEELFIADEDASGILPANNKLVNITDIYGKDWETFPTSGDGNAFFNFYEC